MSAAASPRMVRIFYHCYDHNRPSGGQKDTYQHVEVLTESGIEAYVVHTQEGFRLTWFANNAPVITFRQLRDLYDPERDYIVLPEDLGCKIFAWRGKKVIFNKNIYHGFGALPPVAGVQYPYASPDVLATFTVSKHNQTILRHAFPDHPCLLVKYDIRPDIFRYCGPGDKLPQIAFIAKEQRHLMSLYHMVNARRVRFPGGSPLRWCAISDNTEDEVAELLNQSAIFVFTSIEEGLPRMPLEAMASGCVLATFRGGPADEYLPAAYTTSYGDIVGLCRCIESIARSFPESLKTFETTIVQARDIAARFCRKAQQESVMEAWQSVFALATRGSPR